MSQPSRTIAWVLTVGLNEPTWNFDTTSISSKIFTTNFVELIMSGTSGWSKARVHDDTAVSIVEESASTEDIRT